VPTACRVSPASALQCSLIGQVIGGAPATYRAQVVTLAQQLAHSPDYPQRPAAEVRQLTAAQKRDPLAACRAAELVIMSRHFSSPGERYPELRRAFVYKHKPTQTPPTSPAAQRIPSPLAPGCPRRSRRSAPWSANQSRGMACSRPAGQCSRASRYADINARPGRYCDRLQTGGRGKCAPG